SSPNARKRAAPRQSPRTKLTYFRRVEYTPEIRCDHPQNRTGTGMKYDTTLAKKVEVIELAWIPVSGNRKLAARLFLPRDGAKNPVPCILEYLPYRLRDGTRARADPKAVWFAANVYASARVDIAGTGDSEGLVEDEYVKREQDDALEVIAWLSKQPWCSGNVGMIGISWGGFNGLQIAAR